MLQADQNSINLLKSARINLVGNSIEKVNNLFGLDIRRHRRERKSEFVSTGLGLSHRRASVADFHSPAIANHTFLLAFSHGLFAT